MGTVGERKKDEIDFGIDARIDWALPATNLLNVCNKVQR